MKKFLILLGVIITLLILAIIIVPVVFKDDIQKAVNQSMDETLNARVYYDTEAFSLSLLKNFPNITVSIGDFGIIGVEQFEQDTLASIQNFEVTVDLMSVIGGEQIQVNEILLEQPKLMVLVLEDGQANYDIAKPSDTSNETERNSEESSSEKIEEESDLSVGIKRWAIVDGSLTYSDKSMNFFTTIQGLNHEGSGDFTLEVFDLQTETTVEFFSMGYDGVDYLVNKQIEADVTLNMNLPEMKFTFKDNRFAINQFGIQADGSVSMPNDDIIMDLTFGGTDISLKSIISLIPGVYRNYLDGVTAAGNINFDGYVKGTYNESTMPGIEANLGVEGGSISYEEFSLPMEEINIETKFVYPSADLSQTSFNIDKFSMLVDGEALSAYLKFNNFENYTWDFGFDGNADLEKITQIIPLEGMTLKGRISAGIRSAGQMSLIEAEKYDQLPTSGSLTVDEFYFESADLPQGFGIAKASMKFDPNEIALDQFDANSGSSDFKMKGSIRNYLGFALNEELLSGKLSLSSQLIDLNELMLEDDTRVTEDVSSDANNTGDTVTTEVIRVPENIDFTFSSSINSIAYGNLNITNFIGSILIRDGAVILDENSFDMLDGTFELSGSYDTKGNSEPKYDLGFKIKDLSIASAFQSFSTIQQYVPIAKQVSGKFSTDFQVNGLLGNDMMPLLDKINLEGLVNVAQASLSSGDFMSKLNTIAAFKSSSNSSGEEKSLSLKDVLIKTQIKDGRLFIDPFDLNVKGQKATIGGSNTLDGQLNYSMLIKEIPTGAVGNALNTAMSSLTGGKSIIAENIDIDMGIGGTYDDIKISLLNTSASGSGSNSATAAFKEQINSKVDEERAKAEAQLAQQKEEQRQKLLSEAQKQADKLRAQGKKNADLVRKEGYEAADKLVKEAGSNPIKKKVAEATAKKLRSEADKKAGALEAEANKKADQLIKEAQDRANSL